MTLLKGSMDDYPEPETKGSVLYCKEDHLYDDLSETWVDGDRHSRDELHELLSVPHADSIERSRVVSRMTFDGKTFAWLLTGPICRGPGISTRTTLRGSIKKVDATDLMLEEPFRFAFRMAHPSMPWNPGNCRLVTENAIVEGVRYTEIERSARGDRHLGTDYCRCWVDPRRDDVVVYWDQRNVSSESWNWHGSIDYRKDEKCGWVPYRWRSSCPGRQARTVDATVTSYTINEKLSPELFAPNLPPGTPVWERIAGGRFVVQKDGSMRSITRAEFDRLWAPRAEKK